MSVFKAIIGVKEDKRRYREYRRRIDELPEDYSFVFKKLEDYMFRFVGGDGMDMTDLCSGLLEMFEAGAADGKPVRDIIGDDPAAFCDELIRSAKTGTDKWRSGLNESISRRLGDR